LLLAVFPSLLLLLVVRPVSDAEGLSRHVAKQAGSTQYRDIVTSGRTDSPLTDCI
jgi:hypothetical protein